MDTQATENKSTEPAMDTLPETTPETPETPQGLPETPDLPLETTSEQKYKPFAEIVQEITAPGSWLTSAKVGQQTEIVVDQFVYPNPKMCRMLLKIPNGVSQNAQMLNGTSERCVFFVFTPTIEGQHTIDITIGGYHIAGSPFTLAVAPADPVDPKPEKSVIHEVQFPSGENIIMNIPVKSDRIVEFLIQNPGVTEESYIDTVTGIFASGLFSQERTFPLLMVAAEAGSNDRVSLLLSRGQQIGCEGRLFQHKNVPFFGRVFHVNVAAVVAKWLLDLNSADFEVIQKALGKYDYVVAFAKFACEDLPEHQDLAVKLFLRLRLVPSAASARILLECGAADVFDVCNRRVITDILRMIKEKDSVLRSHKQSAEVLLATCQESVSVCKELQCDLRIAEEKVEEFKDTTFDLENQVSELEAKVAELEAHNVNLTGQNTHLQSEYLSRTNELNQLYATTKITDAVNDTLKHRVAECEAIMAGEGQLSDAAQEFLEQKLTSLESDNKALTDSLEKAQQTISEQAAKIQEKELFIQNLQDQLDAVSRANSTFSAQISGLNNKLVAVKTAFESLNKK